VPDRDYVGTGMTDTLYATNAAFCLLSLQVPAEDRCHAGPCGG
jgi:hypothetical protein